MVGEFLEMLSEIKHYKWKVISKLDGFHLDEAYFPSFVLQATLGILSWVQPELPMLYHVKNEWRNISCDAYLNVYISITVLNDNDINI